MGESAESSGAAPTETALRIDRLGRLGDGLAGLGAARREVAGALPGERVRLDAAGRLAAVIEASPERVSPPCPHAAVCGGCALQHASDRLLADWKRRRIREALAARGLETEGPVDIGETLASPPRSRRRVTLAAVRTKSGVRLGFHRRRSAEIVDLEDCWIARPEIAAALPGLRALARLAAPRKRGIDISVTASETGLDVAIAAAKALDLPLREAAAAWAEATDVARLAWNGEVLAERRAPAQRFGRAEVTPPPGAFLQATPDGEAALARLATAAIGDAARVADLFAGCGTFALRLAETAEVLAVEADPAMVAALETAWRRTGGRLKRVAAIARDLFRRPLSAEELSAVDAVVFDPPRAGAEAQARELARLGPRARTIVGASCDPESFARDAAILAEGGWRLERLTPIDQFRWSPHVELLAEFRR